LLRRASIAGSVEDLERRYEPDYWNEADARASTRERYGSLPSRPDALDADEYRRELRHFYFTVQDLALRRELIAKAREFNRMTLNSSIADLKRARMDLQRIERWTNSRFPTAIFGFTAIVGIAVGHYTHGTLAAVLALGLGMVLLHVQRLRGKREVAAARAIVAIREESFNKERGRAEIFSHAEEISGLQDQAHTDTRF